MDDSDHDHDTKSGIKRDARGYESGVKIFLEMLERSEARIDRTSRITEELTMACNPVNIPFASSSHCSHPPVLLCYR